MLLRLAAAISALLLLCFSVLVARIDGAAVPASTSLDSFNLPSNVARAVESDPSLHRRLTMGCWVDKNGRPPPDDDEKKAGLTEQSDQSSSSSSSNSSDSSEASSVPTELDQGNTTLLMAPDGLGLAHDDPNYIPPLCFDHLHVCYFLSPGVWRDSGTPPMQSFWRRDNTTVLVYRYGKPCAHFTGWAGSGVIYAAHGCILMCGYERMGMKSVTSKQQIQGVAGDPELFCAVDRIKWDHVWVYNT